VSQLDALELVELMRQRIVDLAVSENYIRDEALSEAAGNIWRGPGDQGGLVSELWVQGAFQSECSNDSLTSFATEGLFPKDLADYLDNNGNFPATRPLFTHQADAIRHTANRQSDSLQSLVITAGTGAGKTEAFLLPILAGLWNNLRAVNEVGMRCLILYPMNALVTDQVTRLYDLLKKQDNISLFHYTSETPRNKSQADREGEPKWERCRRRTREEAWENIPDVVITNYSMLEYMLCRPQDRDFFGPALRYIVLDEAHLYTGTLAAEITLLLRRVRDRCGVTPDRITHIAASATLGGSRDDLRRFASTIFSVPESAVRMIEGRKAPLRFDCPELKNAPVPQPGVIAERSNIGIVTLTASGAFAAANAHVVAAVSEVLTELLPPQVLTSVATETRGVLAHLLKNSLEQVPTVRRLAKLVHENDLWSLRDLAKELWGEPNDTTRKATILLLRLTAAARAEPGVSPLVPHRLHFLVRAPEGLSVCLNPACDGPVHLRAGSVGCLQALRDLCVYCHCITLPVHRCKACGQWAMAGYENIDSGEMESGHLTEVAKRRYYLVTDPGARNLAAVVVNPQTGKCFGQRTGTKLFRAPCPEHGESCNDTSACTQQKCPHCDTSWSSSDPDEDDDRDLKIQPLRGAERLGVGVVAETALYGMPVYPDDTREWKPGKGRRLLCFSDSRREAARLGPLLTRQHEVQVIRAAIANTLLAARPPSVEYISRRIQTYEADVTDSSLAQQDREEAKRQLSDLTRQLSFASLGIPVTDFARTLANDFRISELLDRELADKLADKHVMDWRQQYWEDNSNSVAAHAEALIGAEMDNPIRTASSIEAAGLVELAFPGLEETTIPASFAGRLPDDNTRQRLAAAWPDLLAALLDTVRADRAVDWSAEADGREWEGESPLYRRWSTRRKNGWTARRFVGDDRFIGDERRQHLLQLRLWFVSTVLRAVGSLESLAVPMLEAAFEQLYEAADRKDWPWIRPKPNHEVSLGVPDQAIQILFDRLRLRRPSKLFRCPDTGTLWPRTVLGWAPLRGCKGKLHQISHEEADRDRRWGRARTEFRESPIFGMGLWGEEHSAQLSPEENKRRQQLFKEGARNLLSSTTTMELGIDIGGLNGVLLGNVPPGPANHMQRAGRAGRRSDGSSLVVTFARNRPFDREVFHRFKAFLERPFRRQVVDPFLQRDRFSRRHLQAMLLSEFFAPIQREATGAMNAYSNMGRFCGVDSPDRWTGSTKPEWTPANIGYHDDFVLFLRNLGNHFRERCGPIVRGTPLQDLIGVDEDWQAFVSKVELDFRDAVTAWQKDYESLRDAWQEIPKQTSSATRSIERAKANSIRYQINAIRDITVIEWFSDAGFLPRYGFPIHLQRLSVRVPKDGKPEKSTTSERYRLERQSLLALSEYVPGAELLVGGKILESKGILKHWTESNRDEALGLNSWALQCPNEHEYLAASQSGLCPECGEGPANPGQMLMFPRFGYTTAAWAPPQPPGRKLDRVGAVVVTAVGAFATKSATKGVTDYAGVPGLKASYYEAGQAELLLRNAGGADGSPHGHGFAVCTRCGFAMSEKAPANQKGEPPALPKEFRDHSSVFSSSLTFRCWQKGQEFVIRNKVLAARETTDILVFDWPGDCEETAIYSLGRALLLAGTQLLELDSRELVVDLKRRSSGELSVVLYDATPGGAGHCLELMNLGSAWLRRAGEILRGSPEHHEVCRRACLDCLLDFSGQFDAHRLDRRGALELLDAELGDVKGDK